MTDSRYNNINEGIKNIIKYALLECAELEYLDKDIFNAVIECFAAQWWYYEDYNKVYLYYEIDMNMRHTFDPEMVYSTINKNLLNSFPTVLDCHCEILGAPSNWFLLNKEYENHDTFFSDDITAFTISWWVDWQGNKKFINDKHVVKLQLTNFNTEEERRATFANSEYLTLLQGIRARYQNIRITDPDNYNINDYWREYADLYHDRFRLRLLSTDEWANVRDNGGSHLIAFDIFYEDNDDENINNTEVDPE
jgi:hypothetical protein